MNRFMIINTMLRLLNTELDSKHKNSDEYKSLIQLTEPFYFQLIKDLKAAPQNDADDFDTALIFLKKLNDLMKENSQQGIEDITAVFEGFRGEKWNSIASSPERFMCPCCGEFSLEEPMGSFEICPECGWENDPSQLKDPDLEGGANELSLNQAKAKLAE